MSSTRKPDNAADRRKQWTSAWANRLALTHLGAALGQQGLQGVLPPLGLAGIAAACSRLRQA